VDSVAVEEDEEEVDGEVEVDGDEAGISFKQI
jgi:hypothetical protein